MSGPTEEQTKEFQRKMRELLDGIDEQTRRPGEPPLRSVIAEHARDELRKMDERKP